MASFDTAAQLINDAAIELGWEPADVTDPFGSADPNILLLCRLLKSIGRRLVRAHPWSQLTVVSTTFVLTPPTTTYAVATDFDRLVSGSLWNRTRMIPVGVLSPSEWQLVSAFGMTVDPALRLLGRQFVFYSAPASADVIGYEYVSRNWVTTAAAVAADTATAKDDTVNFESALVVAGLKLYALRARNFPTDAAQRDYDEALDAARDADGAASVLTYGGGGDGGLSDPSLPFTNWGT